MFSKMQCHYVGERPGEPAGGVKEEISLEFLWRTREQSLAPLESLIWSYLGANKSEKISLK